MKPKSKRPRDPNQLAHHVLGILTGSIPDNEPTKPEPGKNAAAVELGRRGGKKGGAARAQALSAEKRSEIAKKAATARWHKQNDS